MTAIRLRTGVTTDVRTRGAVASGQRARATCGIRTRGRASTAEGSPRIRESRCARHLSQYVKENNMAEERHGASMNPAVNGMSRRQFVTHALGIGLSAASTAAFLAGCSGGRQSGRRLRTR